jgi:hypothetical protein
MDRFLHYTTQKEPALTASLLAAVLLAILLDDDEPVGTGTSIHVPTKRVGDPQAPGAR